MEKDYLHLNFENESKEGSKYSVPKKMLVLPKSPIVGRNGNVFKYNSDEVVAEFKKQKLEIPIDINHSTELKGPLGDASPALGFINSLEAKEDGIWGSVAWRNEEPLLRGEYKYYSPAIRVKAGKIKRISSIGLVNTPNFMVDALNNENSTKQEKGGDSVAVDIKEVVAALGLNERATTEEVIGKINEQKQVAEKSGDLASEVNKLNSELQRTKQGIFADRREKKIDEAIKEGKIAPATKEFYTISLNSEVSLKAFDDLMAKTGSVTKAKIEKPSGEEVVLNSELAEHCRKYDLDPKRYLERKKQLFS